MNTHSTTMRRESPVYDCRGCGNRIPYRGRGRPPCWCANCGIAAKQRAYREQNKAEIAAKKRAYYEQNKAEIAAKKRAYREQNKAEIAAKQRASRSRPSSGRRGRLVCLECGERLRQPSPSGACGFCDPAWAASA